MDCNSAYFTRKGVILSIFLSAAAAQTNSPTFTHWTTAATVAFPYIRPPPLTALPLRAYSFTSLSLPPPALATLSLTCTAHWWSVPPYQLFIG